MKPAPYNSGLGDTPSAIPENPNPEFYEAISTIYDRLYEEIDAAEAVRQWLLLISRFRPLPENGRLPLPKLLDLGCGPGRYLEPWATAGFCVVGVDASKGMIREARRRMANFSNPSRVSLLCHDLRRPSADLIRCSPFDIAVAHFNFLNLFPLKEVQDILHQLRLYLPTGSRFVTDCAPPSLIPPPGKETLQLGPDLKIQLVTEPDPRNRFVTQIYRREGNELREKYWFHTTPELARVAQRTEWELEAVYSWQPDRPLQPWSPRRRSSAHRVCIFKT